VKKSNRNYNHSRLLRQPDTQACIYTRARTAHKQRTHRRRKEILCVLLSNWHSRI